MKSKFRIIKSPVQILLGKLFTIDLDDKTVDLGNCVPHMKFRIKKISGNEITLTNEHVTIIGKKQ